MSNGDILSELEKDFIAALRIIGPDIAQALYGLAKAAVSGEPEDSIRLQAERATTLILFKAAYHRESL